MKRSFRLHYFLLFSLLVCHTYAQNEDSIVSEAIVDTNAVVSEDPRCVSYLRIENIDQRHFDTNFKDRYQGESFHYEQRIKQSGAWHQFKQWLIRSIQKIFNLASKNQASLWLEYFVKFIILLIIIFVVYALVKAILNKEGGWIFGRDSMSDRIDHTNIEDKIHLANFKELIQSAKSKKDYRLGVRYYYLWLLRNLSDKKYIEWDVNKTNLDYYYEIKDKELRMKFHRHGYIYDYIWYGEFEIMEEDFRQVENEFLQTFNRLHGQ